MLATSSRWIRGVLIGGLIIVAIFVLSVFAWLMDADHGRFGGAPSQGGPMGEVRFGMPVNEQSALSPQPTAPMMKGGSIGVLDTGMMREDVSLTNALDSTLAMGRRVASTGSLAYRVQSLDWSIGKVRETITAKGGYVESLTLNQPKLGERNTWMTVKVPAKEFQGTLDELKQNLYYLTGETITGTDVTAAYIDLKARLDNKKVEEETLKGILAQATKVSDVLDITDRLTTVRTQIESLTGQQRLLDSQTEMSSITLSMIEDPSVVVDTGDLRAGNVWKAALTDLIQSLVRLGSGLVVLLVAGVPIILIYLLLLWLVFRFTKKGIEKFFGR